MNTKKFIEDVLKAWEWEDEPQAGDDGMFSVGTKYEVNDNVYDFYFEVHAAGQLVKFYLYSPVRVPDRRSDVACVVLNRLNLTLYSGRLELAGNKMRYYNCIDVENAEPDVRLVDNMRRAVSWALRPEVAEALGAIGFTKLSAEEIIAQFDAPEDGESNVPDEL